MGLSTTLGTAPAISKTCDNSLPPLGRQWSSRSRQDDRSINALFEDGGLVGIDEDRPLEMPQPKQLAFDDYESCSTAGKSAKNEECKPETPPDEENFRKKWRESDQLCSVSPKLDKRNAALEKLLSHTVKPDQETTTSSKTFIKDDDWGESTDILLMLPDGSELDTKRKGGSERVEKRFPTQKRITSDTAETPYEFGEYQPSCLTGGGGGRRTPVAGRRRASPTNFSAIVCNDGDCVKQQDTTRQDADDINVSATAEASGLHQNQTVKPRLLQRPTVEGSITQGWEESGLDKRYRDNSENSLFERLRQTLVSKGMLESERNQLSNELKQLKDENCLLKEEILKTEKEKLRTEKEMSEMEITSSSALCKQYLEDKEEAQKISVQLSSEIHLLKNTCILADEKLSSLQRVYQEEVDMLKDAHGREMEAKEKQLHSERSFLLNQKHAVNTLTDLVSKSNDWSVKVDEIQRSMVMERESCDKFKREWLEGLERFVTQQHASLNDWCSSVQKQLEEVMSTLSMAVVGIKELQTCEKDSLLVQRANLHTLQEAVQGERAQCLADLASTKQKLEDIRSMCLQDKEAFLQKCFEEKKELAAERDAVLRMKEQVYHADAALEKQLIEHSTRIQKETGELTKQRCELERARIMAAEIAQEVEDGRRELEMRYQAFERDKAEDVVQARRRPDCKYGKGKQKGRSCEFGRSPGSSQLLRLIQHNPWNNSGKQVKRKKFDIGDEDLMANTEALLRLQEQQDFLQEAKNNLNVNKQWSKKFWSGKKIL